eukprot:CAMPEP_0197877114 /NCGR_PEP_ID=MMETSP1439-20131203/5920_1 /TAXON_ID=66791 /ORGANISM="Gonyaulax spinifera, Strain CCMP409" /LENGTH=31 /DNA_ID= /DNA_START= /DNA_END= /DNA_ORIENTATION=
MARRSSSALPVCLAVAAACGVSLRLLTAGQG